MTGLRSIPELARWTSAPVLVMSGAGDPGSGKDALLLGARAYLRKPLDFGRLHRELQGLRVDRPAA